MTKIQNPTQILTDFIEGCAAESLAKQYGVHVTTIYRTLHKFGVQNLKAPGSLSDRNALIAGEHEAGCKIKDIASRYRLSIPGVYAAIRSYKNSCV